MKTQFTNQEVEKLAMIKKEIDAQMNQLEVEYK